MPQIIGHEVVIEVDGMLAVVEINDSHFSHGESSECRYCDTGIYTQCIDRITMGINTWPGGLAPYIVVPMNNIIKLPAQLGFNKASAVLVEPFAAALHAARTADIRPADTIGVLGVGKLGLMLIAAIRLLHNDLKVDAIVRRYKHEHLIRELGARSIVLHSEVDPDTYDVVFDTTGSSEGLEKSIRIARREVHVKSTHGQTAFGFQHLTEMVVDELSLVPIDLLPNVVYTYGYCAPNIQYDLSRVKITHLYRTTIEEMDRFLENEGGQILVQNRGHLPRCDIAFAQTVEQLNLLIRPNKNHDRGIVMTRGTIGVLPGGSDPLLALLLSKGIKISSSRCGDFNDAVTILSGDANGIRTRSLLEQLVTHWFDLEKIEAALEHVSAKGPEVLKVVVNTHPQQ
jgi:threonine dehydrogenase-like Zn-dependent dehydrogenase